MKVIDSPRKNVGKDGRTRQSAGAISSGSLQTATTEIIDLTGLELETETLALESEKHQELPDSSSPLSRPDAKHTPSVHVSRHKDLAETSKEKDSPLIIALDDSDDDRDGLRSLSTKTSPQSLMLGQGSTPYEQEAAQILYGKPSSHKQALDNGRTSHGRTLPFPKRPAIRNDFSVDKLSATRGTSTRSNIINSSDGQRFSEVGPSSSKASDADAELVLDEKAEENPFLLMKTPWTSDGPEDDLSEHVIKYGLQDKPPIPNELASARSTLWPHLKSKSGLQALSFLFTSVMYRRREAGRISTASAFRPPPRITLGDSKREAWLVDLANEGVPLRRLCRTIPHGIHGQRLMHECANRNVPLQRAVWFAKCVGANELRSFRRKGVTEAALLENELKWINEWTVALQSFVLDSLSITNKDKQTEAVSYALRLGSQLFMENLVNREQFLSWALEQLQLCSLNNLAFFLLFLRFMWKDVSSSLMKSHHLAKAALTRLDELSQLSPTLFLESLKVHFLRIIRYLIHHRPLCLISLNEGIHVSYGSSRTLNRKENLLHKFEKERFKAKALCPGLLGDEPILISSPELDLLTALCSLDLDTTLEDLSILCQKHVADMDRLVLYLLQWATSIFSSSVCKVYLVIRLLRYWNDKGLDTDDSLLLALPHLRQPGVYYPGYLCKIIFELVQTGHFDYGRYLRRLIATGGLNRSSNGIDNDLQLLLLAWTDIASTNIVGLRRILAHSTRTHVADQEHQIAEAKRFLIWHLKCLSSNRNNAPPILENTPIASLKSASVYQVSSWLKEHIMSSFSASNTSHLPKNDPVNNQEQFIELLLCISRIFEYFQDFASLATVAHSALVASQLEMLIVVLDIIETNLNAFANCGSLYFLCTTAVSRYRVLRRDEPTSKHVVTHLRKVATNVDFSHSDIRFLSSEALLCDNGHGAAPYTPASEDVIETKVLSKEKSALDDLFPSSGDIDAQTLASVLTLILSRVFYATPEDFMFAASLSLCLRLYRNSNERVFDEVFPRWLHEVLPTMTTTSVQVLWIGALDSDCIQLDKLVNIFKKSAIQQLSGDPESDPDIVLNVIKMLVAPSSIDYPSSERMLHKYCLLQRKHCEGTSHDLVALLIFILCNPAAKHRAFAQKIQAITHHQPTSSFLQSILVGQSSDVLDLLECIEYDTAAIALASVRGFLNLIIDPAGTMTTNAIRASTAEDAASMFSGSETAHAVIQMLFERVDARSLPFFNLGLRVLCSSLVSFPDERKELMCLIVESAQASLARDCVLWPHLVKGLDRYVLEELRTRSESCLLTNYLPLKSQGIAHLSENLENAKRLMAAIETTASSIPDAGCPEVADSITSCLNSYQQGITLQKSLPDDRSQAIGIAQDSSYTTDWQQRLRLLLRVAIIHSRSFGADDCSKMVKLLVTACNILTTPAHVVDAKISRSLLETIAFFSVNATAAARASIINQLNPVLMSDPRLQYIFDMPKSTSEARLRVSSYLKSEDTPSQPQPNSSSLPLNSPQDTTLVYDLKEVATQQIAKELSVTDKETQNPTHNYASSPSIEPISIMTRFPMRRWEMLSDSTLNTGVNDTAVSLRLFEARKV